MTVLLRDFFKNSFVITVDDERLSRFQRVFTKAGLPLPEVFRGHQDPMFNGYENNHVSHHKVKSLALHRGYSHVLIFEDDAYPRADVLDWLDKPVTEEDWDILWIGYDNAEKADRSHEWNLYTPKAKGIIGSHAVIYSRAVLEQIDTLFYNPPRIAKDRWNHLIPDQIAHEIFPVKFKIVIPQNTLFLQYTMMPSAHGYFGYHMDIKNYETPPDGFLPVEHYLN